MTTASLPDGAVGVTYQQSLAANGGAGGNVWSVSAGALPAGLSLGADGKINGMPTAAGTANFTVQVKDSSAATATKALSIAVAPAALSVTTASLPGGTVGVDYQQTLTASGGAGGNVWSVTVGSLPAGLTLGADGSITGMPTASGTANFTVQVKDSSAATATKALHIMIAPAPPLSVTTASLPGGTVGAVYQQSLMASGGAGGNVWSVTVGTLPAGLSLGADGSITGTPTAAGTANFTVQVKDSSTATTTKALRIVIAPATLSVTTASLPGGTVGASYQQTLTATGGAGGNVWSVTLGSLPAGLSLAADGNVTGTPTAAGTANFTVQVKDSSTVTATKALSIAIAPATLSVTTASLPGGTVGAAYQQGLTATGGAGGNAWSITVGALPAGLTLGADGSISGMPTASGTANFTVQVKDSSTATATKALTIAIAPATLSVTTASLPGGTVGAAYQQTLMATGGAGGNAWSVTVGALPPGLSLGADGSVTGTPTSAGTANFTVQVKDSSTATATKALSIAVAPAALSITTASLPGGTVGVAYQQTLAATGGAGGNAWSVTAGALPAGLSLGADGSITGTPTATGASNFTVQVKDSSTATATKALSIADRTGSTVSDNGVVTGRNGGGGLSAGSRGDRRRGRECLDCDGGRIACWSVVGSRREHHGNADGGGHSEFYRAGEGQFDGDGDEGIEYRDRASSVVGDNGIVAWRDSWGGLSADSHGDRRRGRECLDCDGGRIACWPVVGSRREHHRHADGGGHSEFHGASER